MPRLLSCFIAIESKPGYRHGSAVQVDAGSVCVRSRERSRSAALGKADVVAGGPAAFTITLVRFAPYFEMALPGDTIGSRFAQWARACLRPREQRERL